MHPFLLPTAGCMDETFWGRTWVASSFTREVRRFEEKCVGDGSFRSYEQRVLKLGDIDIPQELQRRCGTSGTVTLKDLVVLEPGRWELLLSVRDGGRDKAWPPLAQNLRGWLVVDAE